MNYKSISICLISDIKIYENNVSHIWQDGKWKQIFDKKRLSRIDSINDLKRAIKSSLRIGNEHNKIILGVNIVDNDQSEQIFMGNMKWAKSYNKVEFFISHTMGIYLIKNDMGVLYKNLYYKDAYIKIREIIGVYEVSSS